MKTSTDLFDIIKVMTKSEKGYFKKMSSFHTIGEKNNYIKLFDVIRKQKEYDEKEIVNIFANERFVNQLPVAKNYLYALVLKSLEAYHNNVDSVLYSYLHQIAILYEKELFSQCIKIIKKAKQLAERYENHWHLANLVQWEIRLEYEQSYHGKTEQEIDALFVKLMKSIRDFKNINEYNRVRVQLFLRSMKKGYPKTSPELRQYKVLINHPLLHIKDITHLSYHAAWHFYYIQMYFHFICNDYAAAYINAQKLVEHIELRPHQIKESPSAYITALQSIIIYLDFLKRYDEVPRYIEKLKKIVCHSPHSKNELFLVISNTELAVCINTGQFKEGMNIAKEIQNKLNRGDANIIDKQYQTALFYNMASIYFGGENYSPANKYLNMVLNDTISDLRTDLHCFARILSMIIQFELGKKDLLEYTVRSTYRYLYKRKHLYQLEGSILNFISKKYPIINSQKELIIAFKELKKELEKIYENPFENKASNYFDFISWLESKIEGRAFAEVVREKAMGH